MNGLLEGGPFCPQPAFSRLWPPKKAAAASGAARVSEHRRPSDLQERGRWRADRGVRRTKEGEI